MKSFIKLCLLFMSLQEVYFYADASNNQVSGSTPIIAEAAKNIISKNLASKVAAQVKTESKPASKFFPIIQTKFVNGRVNDVVLVLTLSNNTLRTKIIKMGHHYTYNHEKPNQIKKVVCHEIFAQPSNLSQSDLTSYAAFVFNTDQKLEKYNFITNQEKDLALKRARDSKNEPLLSEIREQTVYHL